MQMTYEDSRVLRQLTAQEVEQVSGAGLFGEWVGRIAVWGSPGGLVADIVSGGALSDAAAQGMGRFEDWVNGK